MIVEYGLYFSKAWPMYKSTFVNTVLLWTRCGILVSNLYSKYHRVISCPLMYSSSIFILSCGFETENDGMHAFLQSLGSILDLAVHPSVTLIGKK